MDSGSRPQGATEVGWPRGWPPGRLHLHAKHRVLPLGTSAFYVWDISVGPKVRRYRNAESPGSEDSVRPGSQSRMDPGRDPRQVLGASQYFQRS